MSKAQEVLENKGVRVYIVPEVATLMSNSGCFLDASKMSDEYNLEFSSNMVQVQRTLEDKLTSIAINEQYETKRPAIILCDRGLFDFSAYVKPEVWQKLMIKQGWSHHDSTSIMDKRYDAVLHLVSSADGAAEFYGFNNKARFETVE